jgi:hypothetical protein
MADLAALLAQYRPFVQYDSLEPYYTDSAAVITDHTGNALKRVDGTVLAMAGAPSGGAVPPLTLDFLRPDTYPTGQPALATDFIGETADYVAAAHEMHGRPGYANKVHGRIVEEPGDTWLQYWFFMYYDDPGFLDLGRHEGDMEMIQVHLDSAGQPDIVTYAQHRSGLRAPWDEVELQNGAPVVFSARGTHASMMRGGTQFSERSFIPDHNDGLGPRVQLELVEISETDTPWAFWPGNWGGTKPKIRILGKEGIEANSPFAMGAHPAWKKPTAFNDGCDQADLPPVGAQMGAERAAPPAPELHVETVPGGGAVNIKYAISPPAAGAPDASQLVIGVDSSGGRLPPAVTVIHHPGESGELEADVDPVGGPVVVRGTTHSAEGAVSATSEVQADGGA